MRKWNNILARVIIVLFVIHALAGSLLLLGIITITIKPLAHFLLAAVILHGLFGIISTFQSIKSGKKSGKFYLKENASFWTKRISGIAIIILIGFHMTAFTVHEDGKFFLSEFSAAKLTLQLLLILAVFIHLAVSIKSMLIAKGTIRYKERTIDWMLVLSLFIMFFTFAMIAYFIQWQM